MLQPTSDHPKIRAWEGGGVRSVCMFVPLSAFRSVAALIGEWAAWSGDGMRQRQPMWCAHPFVTSALRKPSQKALPLWICCGLPQQYVQRAHVSVCGEFCVLMPWQIYWITPTPPPPLVAVEVQGEGAPGPFERLLSFASIQPPSMALFHSPADIFLEPRWMN